MIWVLLVIYQIKHFVADYPLQGKYMLRKFLPTPQWILPLLAHAGVHGGLTCLIALFVKPQAALVLGLFDFIAHLTIDRLKASPNLGGRFKALTKAEYAYQAKQYADAKVILANREAGTTSHTIALEVVEACERNFKSNTYFWWALGADQTLHHLTHYIIIFLLLN
jgi:hypothetical protein